jgi:hypothetical protein
MAETRPHELKKKKIYVSVFGKRKRTMAHENDKKDLQEYLTVWSWHCYGVEHHQLSN